jgi:hypothetical protein
MRKWLVLSATTALVYEEELDVTSRINKYLSDNAFRDIALGQSYFALLGLPDQAPPICAA